MADKYLLECPACGAETDAPGSAYGSTVECHACGEDVPVTDRHIVRKQAADPDRRALHVEQAARGPGQSASAAVEAAFGADEDDEEEAQPTYTRPEPPRHSPLRRHDPVLVEEKCARCGRPFRGDWDRFNTDDGTICYICSNLAVEGVPERVRREQAASVPAPPPTPAGERLIEKELPPKPEETFLGYDTSSPEFQRVLLGAAIATLVVAGLIMLTGWGTPDPRYDFAAEPSIAPEDVPRWLSVSWAIAYRLAIYAVAGLTVYFVLWRRDGLPHDTVRRNALDIGTIMAICAVVGLVATVLAMSVNYGEGVGRIPAVAVLIVGFIVQIGIVVKVYDWRLLDFFWGYIIFQVAYFVVDGVLALVFGGLVRLVT